MQRLKRITLTPADAVVNGIALVQTPAAGGVQALVLAGAAMAAGGFTTDIPRRIAITSTGDESGKTFLITGIGRNGGTVSETLVGPTAAASVNSVRDYASGPLTITISANSAGAIRVGTSQTLSTGWIPVDRYDTNGLGVAAWLLAGAATWDIEHTLDSPFSPGVGVNGVGDPYLNPIKKPDMQGMNATGEGAYNTPITAVRLTLTAFTTGSQVRIQVAPGSMG